MKLNARIALRRNTETISDSGSVTSSLATLAEVWAGVQNGGSSETEKNAQRSMVFTVRRSPETLSLAPKDIVVWNGQTFGISGIEHEPPERPAWIRITASTSHDTAV